MSGLFFGRTNYGHPTVRQHLLTDYNCKTVFYILIIFSTI